ncbi:MAG TPA: M56 family metallopeptidase [Polyangiales bacterium]|nr:M56 family metallopeptidase [Polyangiales bacterium]
MSLHLLIALGSEPSPVVIALAWLLTYLVHTVIWGTAIAPVVRWRALSSSTKSYLWLAALFGPLLTTAFAASSWVGVGRPSISGDVEVRSPSGRIVATRTVSPRSGTVEPLPSAAETGLGWSDAGAALSSSVPAPFASPRAAGAAARVEGAGTPSLAGATGAESRDTDLLSPLLQLPSASAFPVGLGLSSLVAILSVATLLGCLRFFATLVLLWRRQRARTPVTDPRLLERLERLRRRAGLRVVTLTQSSTVDVPLVLGSSEICLPLASLTAASDAEVDAVLAHELAHIERRDGIVFPLVGLVQSIFWWQPLNSWIAARFRQAAELACDDRAVDLTGDPLALARALARVARAASSPGYALTPAMARAQSASVLVARVRRLVHASSRAGSRPHWGWAIASVIAVAGVTSSLSVRAARTPSPPNAVRVALDTRTSALDSGAGATATDRIAELVRREQQLESEIELLQRAAAQHSGDAAARILELQQQLRHVRETAAWVERTFVGESSP